MDTKQLIQDLKGSIIVATCFSFIFAVVALYMGDWRLFALFALAMELIHILIVLNK